MSRRLDWAKANKLIGKQHLDYRREFEFPDRADRWLAAVERRQAQRRQARPRERRRFQRFDASQFGVGGVTDD
jgi:hypothetical protein